MYQYNFLYYNEMKKIVSIINFIDYIDTILK